MLDIQIFWYDDGEMQEHTIEQFWTNLSNERDSFLMRNSKKIENWESAKIDEKKVKIVPEFCLYKSPITFLNGEWGIGKTSFLIEAIKHTKKWEKFYKNIKFFDLWTYENSINPSEHVFMDVLRFLIEINYEKIKKNKKYKKILKSKIWNTLGDVFDGTILSIFRVVSSMDLSLQKIKEINDENKKVFQCLDHKIFKKMDDIFLAINIIDSVLDETLIVLDNIERMTNPREIMSAINLLSRFKNVHFLLPINLNYFDSLISRKNIPSDPDGERMWQKFTNTKIFTLLPNFKPILSNLGVDNKALIYTDWLFKEILYLDHGFNQRRIEIFLTNNIANISNESICLFLIEIYRKIVASSLELKITSKFDKIFNDLGLKFYEILAKTYKTIEQKNPKYDHKKISDILWNSLIAIANKNDGIFSIETKECVANIYEFLNLKTNFLKDRDLELISKYLVTNQTEYMYQRRILWILILITIFEKKVSEQSSFYI